MNSKIEDASHHMGGLIYNPNKNLSNVDKNLKIMGLKIFMFAAVLCSHLLEVIHHDYMCIKCQAGQVI